MRHDEKYLLINQGFAGKQRLMPFFNRQNNDDLILAIQAAGVSRGRNGFRKDKGGEKLAESEEDLLEHRTDGTDAFDTLYRNLRLQCIQVRLRSAKLMRALFCPHWHEQSIRSTSAARNFPTAMLLHSPYWAHRKIIPCFYIM